ncbi:unnamed protein product, partial [Ectocarpus sp. 12 AP-2014]
TSAQNLLAGLPCGLTRLKKLFVSIPWNHEMCFTFQLCITMLRLRTVSESGGGSRVVFPRVKLAKCRQQCLHGGRNTPILYARLKVFFLVSTIERRPYLPYDTVL